MSAIQWVIRVERGFAEQLILLKNRSGVQVCDAAGSSYVWAKGTVDAGDAFAKLDTVLRSITSAIRYRDHGDGDLVRFEERLVSAQLPQESWQALGDWISIELPGTTLVGRTSGVAQVRFQRGPSPITGHDLEPSLLRCSLAQFESWAATAPQVRLECLTFACNADQEVLVRGYPLPSMRAIRARRWVEYENLAVPIGWSWSPAVSVRTLIELFQASDNEIILVEENNRWRRLDRQVFVKASRIAVRMTAGSFLASATNRSSGRGDAR
jgi:hypothetical protein